MIVFVNSKFTKFLDLAQDADGTDQFPKSDKKEKCRKKGGCQVIFVTWHIL